MPTRRRRWLVVIAWVATAIAALVAAGLGLAYSYVTDGSALGARLEREAPRYLPGSQALVGRVRIRPAAGVVTLENLSIRQPIDGDPFATLRVAWMRVRYDVRAALEGRIEPREIVLAQPTLRLVRRRDGRWNLQGLLADPWPGPPLERLPTVIVRNGTVQLQGEDGKPACDLLRNVTMQVEPTGDGLLRVEGEAEGVGFESLKLAGRLDPKTGRLDLDRSTLDRLDLGPTLRRRLPADWQPSFDRLGLTAGEADLAVNQLRYDPAAAPGSRLTYAGTVRLRGGSWACPDLPFPLNDLSAAATVTDRTLTIERAEGSNGRTLVRGSGRFDLTDPVEGPFELAIVAKDLDVDDRLKARTPAAWAGLWDDYAPRGRVDATVRVSRPAPGAAIRVDRAIVDCRDVDVTVRAFPYPFEHVTGRLDWEGPKIEVDLATLVGGRRATCVGTITDPGPGASAKLILEAAAVPIDETLFAALEPPVRRLLGEFRPSGTVRLTSQLDRRPPTAESPKGKVVIHSILDLDGRCAFTWKGLPYPVRNLSGQVQILPDRWVFKDLRGWNGTASLRGDGWARPLANGQLEAELSLSAKGLPFDEQLERAVPAAWRSAWRIVNPSGTSDVTATVAVGPGREHYRLEVVPGPEARLLLRFTPTPAPGSPPPAGPLELPPLERIAGRFVFDDGAVTMADASFTFRGSPVRFSAGTMTLEDGGRFSLGVTDMTVAEFRLDGGLRKLMPPVMADFARRFDESTPLPLIRGDLKLGWSGTPGEPAWCEWERGLVVFGGNSIDAGLPLRSLQGQLGELRGRSDGRTLEVHGKLDLDSVHIFGQQVTRLRSPLDVADGRAQLDDLRAALLGGTVTGKVGVALDATPRYTATLAVAEADLAELARSLPGPQGFGGKLSGQLAIEGRGDDLRTLEGRGDFRIADGDLGELPIALRFFKYLQLSPATKTAFDAAEVSAQIRDGRADLDPIRFTGDAVSLNGRGTLDLRGELDLRLRLAYGRDRLRVPLVGPALREATARIFDIRVSGPVSFPRFQSEVLPQASDLFRTFGRRSASAFRGEGADAPKPRR